MMLRRSFLKSILGAIASVALAQKIAVEAFSSTPVTEEAPFPKLNPAWADARYEAISVFHPDLMTAQPFPENMGETRVRFTFDAGQFKKVPHHLP